MPDETQGTRRLLFAPELASGRLRPSQLARAEVRAAATARVVPSRVSRAYQRRLMRRGRLGYEQHTVPLHQSARAAVLGDEAAGPPRLLVRIDAPLGHPVHGRLATAGLPTLVAAPGRRLNDAELAGVAELRRAGGSVGLELPRMRDLKALKLAIDAGLAMLASHTLHPEVGIARAPTWRAWPVLAGRFSVVCGDPESVDTFGFHDTPQSRGSAVWMPAWPPFAGPAAAALAGARHLAEQGAALWVPVLLDGDDPDLDAFADQAAQWAVPWNEVLQACAGAAA